MFSQATSLFCLAALITVTQSSPIQLLLKGQVIKGDVLGDIVETSPPPSSCIGSIKIETITVEGNCCWRVATKNNGRGRTRDFVNAVTESNHQV